MRLASLAAMRSWPDLAVEAAFRWRPVPPLARPLSWPLPQDIRKRVRLRWPRLHAWSTLGKTDQQLLPAFAKYIDVELQDIAQPHKSAILAEFLIDGRAQPVAFDVVDDPEACFFAGDPGVLTFKRQYRHGGYGNERVMPGGYIASDVLLYRMAPYLHRLHDTRPRLCEVSGRFGSEFATELRSAAVHALAGTGAFRFHGAIGRVRYSRYLRETARSRVSVDLPGNGPLCFRLVEYLAVGACIVAYPHACRLPVALVDGEHLLYVREDLSDLVERCQWCLEHPREAALLSAAAREYFLDYLHREQLTAYYLHTLLQRLP